MSWPLFSTILASLVRGSILGACPRPVASTVAAPSSVSQDAVQRYQGTFADSTLTLELHARRDGYVGTIRHGQVQYPATARDTGYRLEGTFESSGTAFEFTATLHGGILTFTTDGTAYTLRKQSAVAAPFILFRLVHIRDRDDMIGGAACTLLAPADWKVDGGIAWRLHPAMPAGLACRIYDPYALTAVECFPALPYSWGSHLEATSPPPGFGLARPTSAARSCHRPPTPASTSPRSSSPATAATSRSPSSRRKVSPTSPAP